MPVKEFPEPQILAAQRSSEMRTTIQVHVKRECGDPNPSPEVARIILIELLKLIRNDILRLVQAGNQREFSIKDVTAMLYGVCDKLLIMYEGKNPPFYPSLNDGVTDYISALTEAELEIVWGPRASHEPALSRRGLRLMLE